MGKVRRSRNALAKYAVSVDVAPYSSELLLLFSSYLASPKLSGTLLFSVILFLFFLFLKKVEKNEIFRVSLWVTLDVHVQVWVDLSKETPLAFCLSGI